MEQVGGVVRLHRLEHVSSAARLERGEDRDLVVLRELLEDVGEPLVVERLGDLEPAVVGEVVQRVGKVGGFEVLVGREEQARPLLLLGRCEGRDGADVDDLALVAPSDAESALRGGVPSHEESVDDPVAAALELDRYVLDAGRA